MSPRSHLPGRATKLQRKPSEKPAYQCRRCGKPVESADETGRGYPCARCHEQVVKTQEIVAQQGRKAWKKLVDDTELFWQQMRDGRHEDACTTILPVIGFVRNLAHHAGCRVPAYEPDPEPEMPGHTEIDADAPHEPR